MSRFRTHLRLGAFGVALGYVLSRTGFSDFAEVHRMFALEDARLFATFAGGVAAAGLAFALLRERLPRLPSRPVHRGTIPGAVLFGAGWALTGACPAVALVQLGEGRPIALATAAGILGGTWLAQRLREKLAWDTGSCSG